MSATGTKLLLLFTLWYLIVKNFVIKVREEDVIILIITKVTFYSGLRWNLLV